jgi:hypothetical protein
VKHLALAAPISSLGVAAGGLLQVGTIGYLRCCWLQFGTVA